MSLLFLDSFDDRSTGTFIWSKYEVAETSNAGCYVGAQTGRTGNAMRMTYNAGTMPYLRKVFPSAKTTIIVGVWVYCSSVVPSGETKFIRIMDGSTEQVALVQMTTGVWGLRNASGTLLATGTTPVGAVIGNAQYLELSVTIGNTTGAYTLRINGAIEFTASNVDTQNTSNASLTGVEFTTNVNGPTFTIDDLYICDTLGTTNNTFLGAIKIECKFPNAPGTTTQMTPVGIGANWDAVNDTNPDDDTTYVNDSVVGHKDTYALQDMTATAGTIVGTQVSLRARRDDLAVRKIARVIRSGGTDYVGADIAMTNAYAVTCEVVEKDPATANPWSLAGINALELGLQITA